MDFNEVVPDLLKRVEQLEKRVNKLETGTENGRKPAGKGK